MFKILLFLKIIGRKIILNIMLQLTLQSLQQVQGGHILLKTDSGHYQLLRVASPGQVSGFTSNTGNYKIQNIPPAVSEVIF